MKRWLSLVLLVVLVHVLPAGAAELAPEHEMRRLLIVAKDAVDSGSYARAAEALQKIAGLKISPDEEFYFLRGVTASKQNQPELAEQALVEYVNQAGSEGEHYQEALKLITALQSSPEPEQSPAPADIDWSQVVVSQNEQYLQELMALYLTASPEKALVEHINSILAANVYVPGRIRNLNENEGVHYRISTNSRNDLVLQETDYTGEGNASHELSSLAVFGVDPYIRSDCDYGKRLCWLWHPVESQQRWIVMAENQAALQELTRAMTQLIRMLQQ